MMAALTRLVGCAELVAPDPQERDQGMDIYTKSTNINGMRHTRIGASTAAVF